MAEPGVLERVLLDSREAAALLKVSIETLHAMAVPYLTIGQGKKRPRRRYLRETLEQWAREEQQTG